MTNLEDFVVPIFYSNESICFENQHFILTKIGKKQWPQSQKNLLDSESFIYAALVLVDKQQIAYIFIHQYFQHQQE